jgi:hypothetical protein
MHKLEFTLASSRTGDNSCNYTEVAKLGVNLMPMLKFPWTRVQDFRSTVEHLAKTIYPRPPMPA